MDYFEGVPKEILFDNAKCIMIQRDAYGKGKHQWNPALLDQALHAIFKPMLATLVIENYCTLYEQHDGDLALCLYLMNAVNEVALPISLQI